MSTFKHMLTKTRWFSSWIKNCLFTSRTFSVNGGNCLKWSPGSKVCGATSGHNGVTYSRLGSVGACCV